MVASIVILCSKNIRDDETKFDKWQGKCKYINTTQCKSFYLPGCISSVSYRVWFFYIQRTNFIIRNRVYQLIFKYLGWVHAFPGTTNSIKLYRELACFKENVADSKICPLYRWENVYVIFACGIPLRTKLWKYFNKEYLNFKLEVQKLNSKRTEIVFKNVRFCFMYNFGIVW